jgi:hypothetical protein
LTLPDQPPGEDNDLAGQTGSAYTIRLTRDTLILLAAIGFLGLAILLALLFPPSPSTGALVATPTATGLRATLPIQATQTPGSVAGAPTSTLSAPVATQGAALIPTSLPEPTAPAAYPGPGGATTPLPTVALATGVPLPTAAQPGAGAAATASPPVFNPTVPSPIVAPTNAPTARPAVTGAPAPTSAPAPTQPPAQAAPPSATPQRTSNDAPPPASPRPTAPPVAMLRGTTYWRAANSPYVITQDLLIAPGAALLIDPGVEVRLAPGVSLTSQGKLYALGQPGAPVRFVGSGQRWEGIFGRAGSDIVLEHAEIQGGGAGGTLIGVENGALALRGVRVNDNGGQIRVDSGRLEVRDSEIAGNDMPYGAALEASFQNGGSTTIANTRIGGNRMAAGAPQILIRNEGPFGEALVDLQGNLLIGQDGPNITLSATQVAIRGTIACNAMLNGSNGLSVRSETLQTPGFPLAIHDNAIDDHVPPIVPVYLEYGIGRGATSEVALDMRNNWWGSEIGPYEPDRHGDGRGDSVGENIDFDPWLTAWPACAPHP